MDNENIIGRDKGLDILSAMRGDVITDDMQTHPDSTGDGTEVPAIQDQQESIPQKSALDMAIEGKKKSRAYNGIVNDDELTDEESGPLRKNSDNDEAIAEFNEIIAEIDDEAKKAEAVVVIKLPEDRVEYFQMHDEISRVTFDKNGTVVIPEGAKFIVPKTEKLIKIMEERRLKEEAAKAGKSAEAEKSNSENGDDEGYAASITTASEEYKGSIVKILIDKTGFGANIKFDDEEKKAISVSTVIQLHEVEDKDLRVIDVVRPENSDISFMQAIEANKMVLSKSPVIFANSGFEGTMSGLNWGEFADVALNPDYEPNMGYNDVINFDKQYKRLSIIYNNLKNVSVGAFKDFEDFLKHFAYDDTEMALYSILIATQPERDKIYLNCPKCGKRFVHVYSPRTILNVDSASVEALDRMTEISDASPDKRLDLYNNSRVSKFKRVEVDRSKYIVDIGAASAYDYLYYILPIIRQITLDAWRMPDHILPPTDPRRNVPNLITGIRNVYIPNGSGSYYRASKADDIYDAVMNMPVEDVEVLNAAVAAYREQYLFTYSFKTTKCTHCGFEENDLRITPQDLLFQIRLHQLNTSVTVKNFPTL